MTTSRRPIIFWRIERLRALAESASLGALYVLGLLLLKDEIGPQHIRQAMWFLSPLCALICALRLRLPRGSPWHRLGYEATTAILLSALLIALLLLVMHQTSSDFREADRPFPEWFDWLFVTCAGVAFMGLRVGVRLWWVWDRLRRRRLVWALTHAHLTLVVLAALPVVAFLIYVVARQGYTPDVTDGQDSLVGSIADRLIVTILPALFVYSLLAVIALAAVLPPFALVSFFVARRTTHRLEALLKATGALSAGDYAARVDVVGEDEVAQLQADFNAMAADLQRTLLELEAERDKVAGLLASRQELVASVSHDLRTPVATLRGYLDSVLGGWDQSPPPTLRHDLQVMQRETRRLQALIDDLFTLARVDAGHLTLQPRPTNIARIVERLVDSLAPLAWQSGRVQVVAEVAPDLPPALVDEGRLEQVLGNLIHNGVRHTPPGGVVAVMAAAESHDPQSEAGPALCIQVQDTGEGIPPEELANIWERFYRGQTAHDRDSAGAGLGLALVKDLTEAMGGSVAVSSTLGKGSCFTVRLPQA